MLKLKSHKLEFQNPTFTSDVMVTVRNGPKWSKRVKPGMIVTVAETGGDDLNDATITGILTTTFERIPPEVLFREHDPKCRTREGLLKEMKRVYPGFEKTNEVTVLFFTFFPEM